jgi:hypothetical protein
MASTLDTLLVRIEADVSQLRRGLDQAGRLSDDAGRRMARSFAPATAAIGGVSRALSTFGVALGAAAIAGFTKRTIDAVGGLGEMADQLGVSTDALQAYQFAATQVGLSQEQLQQGLGRLTRQIGDAASGNDVALRSFKALGIGVLDASGRVRSTEDILGDVADALKDIEDPARRATIAYELLGRAGQKFLPFLQDGRQGLRNLGVQARESGAILDKELIARFDQISDAIQRAKIKGTVAFANFMDGILSTATEVSGKIMEKMKPVVDAMVALDKAEKAAAAKRSNPGQGSVDITEVMKQFQPGDPSLDRDLEGQRGRGGFGALTQAYNPESTAFKQARAQLEALRDGIDQTAASQLKLRLEREVDERGIRRWTDEEVNALVAIQQEIDLKTRLSDANKTMMDIATQNAKQQEDDRKKASERAQAIINEKAKIERGMEVEVEENDRLLKALQESNRAYDEERILLDIINRYRAAGIPLTKEEIEQKKTVAKQINDQSRAIDRQREANAELENFADRAFDRIGDAMTRMAVEGKDAWKDWRNLAKGVISEIMQEFMKLAVLNPLKNAIFGGNNATLGDINFSKLFGGGGSSYTGSSGGLPGGDPLGWVQRNLKGFPFFADGGRPKVGVPAIVGEEGPELFVPDVAGSIVPNHKIGGGGPVFNVDMRGASADAVVRLERLVRNLNGSIESRAIMAVSDARQRGLVPA